MLIQKEGSVTEIQQKIQKEEKNPKGLSNTSFPDLFILENHCFQRKKRPVHVQSIYQLSNNYQFTKTNLMTIIIENTYINILF